MSLNHFHMPVEHECYVPPFETRVSIYVFPHNYDDVCDLQSQHIAASRLIVPQTTKKYFCPKTHAFNVCHAQVFFPPCVFTFRHMLFVFLILLFFTIHLLSHHDTYFIQYTEMSFLSIMSFFFKTHKTHLSCQRHFFLFCVCKRYHVQHHSTLLCFFDQ